MSGVGFSHSDPGLTRSSIGMMIGGSATMRSSPSTSSARLANTRVLSRVRALATISSVTLASSLLTRLTRTALLTILSSIPASRCSYHASRVPHPGGPAHPVPVLGDPGHDHGTAVGRGEAAVAAHDLEARRQPLHVPLPRAGEGLVEIVDVEEHPPFRRAEQAEVRQVGVTAQLHGDPGDRGCRQVGCHDQRGAPVEREGGDQHPPVPDRDQLRHPARRPAPRAARSGRDGPARAPTGRGSTVAPAPGRPGPWRCARLRSGAPAARSTRTGRPPARVARSSGESGCAGLSITPPAARYLHGKGRAAQRESQTVAAWPSGGAVPVTLAFPERRPARRDADPAGEVF